MSIKKCTCGKEYTKIPKDAKIVIVGDALDGAYWNCSCNSTLYLPVDEFTPDDLEGEKV